MRPILSERNIVVLLFVMVLVTFALAQEDSRKMELVQVAATSTTPQQLLANKPKEATTVIIIDDFSSGIK